MQTDETTVDPPEGDPPGTGGGEEPSTEKTGTQLIAPEETLGDPPGTGGGDQGDPPGTGGGEPTP